MNRKSKSELWKSVRVIGFAVGLVMATATHAFAADGPVVIQTTNGPVQAVERSATMRSYFAIPFAAAPVGNLRWQPPAR